MDIKEKEAIATLSRKVDKILFYLESDPTTNSKGIVENVSLLDKRLCVLEDDKTKIKAKITLIASVSGFILILVKELWSKIIPIE